MRLARVPLFALILILPVPRPWPAGSAGEAWARGGPRGEGDRKSKRSLVPRTRPRRRTPAKAAGKKAARPVAQESLADIFARRMTLQTGVPVRIGDLTYEMLTSTFAGQRIEAGPAGRPFLLILRLSIELQLFGGGPGITVVRISARGPRVTAPAGWLVRRIRLRTYRPITVRSVRITGGRLRLNGQKSSSATLGGVAISLDGLRVPVIGEGQPITLGGALSVIVAEASMGGEKLREISLRGELKGSQLQVSSLTARLLGGTVTLSGIIGLMNNTLETVDLQGKADLLPWGKGGPGLQGAVRLAGAVSSGLALTGEMTATAPLIRRRGGDRTAPSLRLDLSLGRRRLQGSLRRWQIR